MKNIYLLVACLLYAGLLSAQADVKALRTYIEDLREAYDVPGLAVGIIKDGKVVMAEGFGEKTVGTAEKINDKTTFAIASNTKAYVATALAILVGEERISWDDKVIDHLPYFRLYDDYVTQHTTIRDLLCHRVGLGTFSGDAIWYKRDITAEQVVKYAAHVPQAFEFRSGFGYSNLMFITAGEVIRAVTGKSWDAYLQEKVFSPLGQKRTFTRLKQFEGDNNVATPHKWIDGKNMPIPYTNWDNMGAAGGIYSCVSDMVKWMQLNLDDGVYKRDTLFPTNATDQLWRLHNSYTVTDRSRDIFPSRHFNGYGLGWGLYDLGGNMVVTHGGGYDGMYSRVAMVPDQNLGVVVLTNGMKGIATPLTYHIFEQYLDIKDNAWEELGPQGNVRGMEHRTKEVADFRAQRKMNTQPLIETADLIGSYYDPMYGTIMIGEENGQLRLYFGNSTELSATLTHWHYDTYFIKWDKEHAWFDIGTVKFLSDNHNQPTELQFDVPNGDIFFHEIHAKKK